MKPHSIIHNGIIRFYHYWIMMENLSWISHYKSKENRWAKISWDQLRWKKEFCKLKMIFVLKRKNESINAIRDEKETYNSFWAKQLTQLMSFHVKSSSRSYVKNKTKLYWKEKFHVMKHARFMISYAVLYLYLLKLVATLPDFLCVRVYI